MKQIVLLGCAMLAILMLTGSASAGDQIDTSNILLMGYYDNNAEIDLSQAIQEFDHVTETTDQYVEGIITIWHDTYDGINTGNIQEYEIQDGNETDILLSTDVTVRVKSDGWIVAWLTNDQNTNDFVFWKCTYHLNNPLDTTIGQSIYRITNRIGTNYDKNIVNYYSYKYPAADRLLIGGGTVYSYDQYTYHFLVPSAIELYIAKLTSALYIKDRTYYPHYVKIKLDDEYILNKSTSGNIEEIIEKARYSTDVSDITRDTRHTIYQKMNACNGYGVLKSAVIILYQS